MQEYCSPVWMSATASHFGLLDRVVSKAIRRSDGLVVCDLKHRRRVTDLHFYKIHCNPEHALETTFPRVVYGVQPGTHLQLQLRAKSCSRFVRIFQNLI